MPLTTAYVLTEISHLAFSQYLCEFSDQKYRWFAGTSGCGSGKASGNQDYPRVDEQQFDQPIENIKDPITEEWEISERYSPYQVAKFARFCFNYNKNPETGGF